MKIYYPPKKTLYLYWVRSICVFLAIAVITYLVGSLTEYIAFVYILAAVTVLLCLFDFLYIPLFLKSYQVKINETAVIVKSGIIIRHERIMPSPRMVYVEKIQSPLGRLFGLSALAVRAARAVTPIIELDMNDVFEITQNIGQKK